MPHHHKINHGHYKSLNHTSNNHNYRETNNDSSNTQSTNLAKENLNFSKSKALQGDFIHRVSDNGIAMKKREFESHLEGRFISSLSKSVLPNNPTNVLYYDTMKQFDKAYSQKKRGSVNFTDCSAFVSSLMNDLFNKMSELKDDKNQSVFNLNSLAASRKAIPLLSTTSFQDTMLNQLYEKNHKTPNKYKGSQVANAFLNEKEIGKVIIMDKDSNPNTVSDRHIWISVRNPNNNKIEWAESTSGIGVIISSPDELFQRNKKILNDHKRSYVLYDPLISSDGWNRKKLNDLDLENMALTVVYLKEKKKQQLYTKVSGHQPDIKSEEVFKQMEKILKEDQNLIKEHNVDKIINHFDENKNSTPKLQSI